MYLTEDTVIVFWHRLWKGGGYGTALEGTCMCDLWRMAHGDGLWQTDWLHGSLGSAAVARHLVLLDPASIAWHPPARLSLAKAAHSGVPAGPALAPPP